MQIRREWTTPITAGSFLLVAVTGVLMFFHTDMGLNRMVHEWLSWLFLAVAVFHLAVNFTAFKKYVFADGKGKLLLGVFILVLGLSFAPLGGEHEPPFAPPLRALAELPLATLAQVAKTTPENLLERAERAAGTGASFMSQQQTVRDLVGDDLRRQVHLLNVLLAEKQ